MLLKFRTSSHFVGNSEHFFEAVKVKGKSATRKAKTEEPVGLRSEARSWPAAASLPSDRAVLSLQPPPRAQLWKSRVNSAPCSDPALPEESHAPPYPAGREESPPCPPPHPAARMLWWTLPAGLWEPARPQKRCLCGVVAVRFLSLRATSENHLRRCFKLTHEECNFKCTSLLRT